MSRLVPGKKVGFLPADAASGVVGSRLYYGPPGSSWDSSKDADYDKPFVDLGQLPVQTVTLPDSTSATLRVADTSQLPGTIEGDELVALVDYDAAGNLSDFSSPVSVPLDHQAPPTPQGGVVLF